jgi:hypothetical protein
LRLISLTLNLEGFGLCVKKGGWALGRAVAEVGRNVC